MRCKDSHASLPIFKRLYCREDVDTVAAVFESLKLPKPALPWHLGIFSYNLIKYAKALLKPIKKSKLSRQDFFVCQMIHEII